MLELQFKGRMPVANKWETGKMSAWLAPLCELPQTCQLSCVGMQRARDKPSPLSHPASFEKTVGRIQVGTMTPTHVQKHAVSSNFQMLKTRCMTVSLIWRRRQKATLMRLLGRCLKANTHQNSLARKILQGFLWRTSTS